MTKRATRVKSQRECSIWAHAHVYNHQARHTKARGKLESRWTENGNRAEQDWARQD